MEKDLSELLKQLGLPGALGVAVWGVITFIKLGPITMITKDQFDKKFLSMESRAVIVFCRFIWKAILSMIIFFGFSCALYKKIPNYIYHYFNCFLYVTVILGLVSFLFLHLKKDLKKRGSFFVFLLFFALFELELNVMVLNAMDKFNSIAGLIMILILSFITTLFFPLGLSVAYKIYKGIKEQSVYIYIKGERWFVLRPFSKGTILLGDNNDPKLCTKRRVVKIEDLYNKNIFNK